MYSITMQKTSLVWIATRMHKNITSKCQIESSLFGELYKIISNWIIIY